MSSGIIEKLEEMTNKWSADDTLLMTVQAMTYVAKKEGEYDRFLEWLKETTPDNPTTANSPSPEEFAAISALHAISVAQAMVDDTVDDAIAIVITQREYTRRVKKREPVSQRETDLASKKREVKNDWQDQSEADHYRSSENG